MRAQALSHSCAVEAFPERPIRGFVLSGVAVLLLFAGGLGNGPWWLQLLSVAIFGALMARMVWEYRLRIVVTPEELVIRSWRQPIVWPRADVTRVEVVLKKPRGLSRLRVTSGDGRVWFGGPPLNEVEASDLRAGLARAGYPLATAAFPLP